MLLLVLLVSWHGHRVADHDRKIIAAEDQRLTKRINDLTAKAVELRTKTALLERAAHEKEVSRIHDTVERVILRGPGKAQCPSSTFAAGSSGHEPTSGSIDAGVVPMPDQGGPALIALPFNDAIRFAGQCDINRDEVLRWRADRQKAIENDSNFRP
jgi:hypothetical protein